VKAPRASGRVQDLSPQTPPKPATHVLTRNVVIDCRNAVHDYILGARRASPNLRVVVRGALEASDVRRRWSGASLDPRRTLLAWSRYIADGGPSAPHRVRRARVMRPRRQQGWHDIDNR